MGGIKIISPKLRQKSKIFLKVAAKILYGGRSKLCRLAVFYIACRKYCIAISGFNSGFFLSGTT
jgi:hypothetical protein